jgi:GNAT superfamily N-acetyltransferase
VALALDIRPAGPDGGDVDAASDILAEASAWLQARGITTGRHRLAVRRAHAGVGPTVLEWAEATSRARGRAYLCLDTLTSNTRLRRYYEELGFHEVGEIVGPAEHLTDPALGPWRATLYERAIQPPAV